MKEWEIREMRAERDRLKEEVGFLRSKRDEDRADNINFRDALLYIQKLCSENYRVQPDHIMLHRLEVDIPTVCDEALNVRPQVSSTPPDISHLVRKYSEKDESNETRPRAQSEGACAVCGKRDAPLDFKDVCQACE